ncbi:MAG TPA: hypothetical protein VFO93_02370 [Hymenobacter sp.]|uniref:hypothetical protein n=1 Tax=Hymenobacter sp. TaxID=1898978 RepID=UPI002D810789|nr:hypothetical protein [Hymenobacter sp.]HET9502358.1 hypothetical protein [Hymenobacter sp.]
MQNLLWSALNAGLFIGLVYLFFRAAKLVKQHMGWPATVFFVVGLTIIAGKPTSSLPGNENLLPSIPKDAPLGNASTLKLVSLGGSNNLNLLAEYHQQNGLVRPRGLYAFVSGFWLGHTWQPVTGRLEQRGSQLRYSAVLTHSWNLLGVPVFHQTTDFTGLIPIKNSI